jgi:hypothetical protein
MCDSPPDNFLELSQYTEPVFVKRLWNPEIDSEKSIQLAFIAWLAGTTNSVGIPSRQPGNRFLGSLKGPQIRALYKNCRVFHGY